MTTKNTRRRMSRRGILLTLALIAFCSWGGLLVFTYYVQPQAQAALFAFFLLGLALWSTCTLLIHFVLWAILARRSRRPGLTQALREGGLFSAWLIFNLLLSALSSWNIFSAVVSFGIILVIELLILGRSS